MNLIILSDHGMETVTYDRIIYLDKYVSSATYKGIFSVSNVFVNPNPGTYFKKCKIQIVLITTIIYRNHCYF